METNPTTIAEVEENISQINEQIAMLQSMRAMQEQIGHQIVERMFEIPEPRRGE